MTFKKGQSGNPGGRAHVVTADGKTLRQLARDYTEEALNVLVSVMRDEEAPPPARVSAATNIHDRGWGKPTQPVSGDDEAPPIRHELDLSKLSEQTLREIAAAS